MQRFSEVENFRYEIKVQLRGREVFSRDSALVKMQKDFVKRQYFSQEIHKFSQKPGEIFVEK